jgi:glutaredoxin
MDRPKLQLYGTDWCPKSAGIRNYLQGKWIAFEDFNVETDTVAAAKIRSLYDGKLKFPTVMAGDDCIKYPSVPELNEFLRKHHIDS